MDFDEDMSGLQIEDLGEYFLQTDNDDNWKGFLLGYADEELQQDPQPAMNAQIAMNSVASAHSAAQYSTSPPHASISEIFKYSGQLEIDMGYVSPGKDIAKLLEAELPTASANPDAEVANVSSKQTSEKAFLCPYGNNRPATSMQCQNINMDSSDEMNNSKTSMKAIRVCSTIGSSCSEPLLTLDDDRGLRKKSREKMRRHEVNVKFEELADLLGLSNRFRKSAVLQEAVSIIKNLKRERNELRRDRDCLQQEVSKLVTCLQYSHLGPVATASLTQPNQQLSRMKLSNHHHRRQAVANLTGTQPVHTHPFHESCDPGINCFPLSSAFCNVSCQQTSNLSSGSSQVVIAPKGLKPKVINSIKPDTEIE